ncbi:hypothetical protein BMETH_1227_0 [methanotrophic bacterial endosymbiont of Bathymodiolus sp.]|nr:hypothetical protein BMETH_1227_0 [methanotrophic bacterial endosymbiont of Bathymodiolus sp.]
MYYSKNYIYKSLCNKHNENTMHKYLSYLGIKMKSPY